MRSSSALEAAVAGGAGVVAIWLAVVYSPAATGLDERIGAWTQGRLVADGLMARVTDLGASPVALAVCAAVAVLALWRREFLVAAYVMAVPLGAMAAYTAVKHLTDRERPTLNPAAAELNSAFPSGHSAMAAAAYSAVAVAVILVAPGLTRRGARSLGAAAAAIATAVAATRVLLGLHWFSDVIAGLVLGWTWWAVCTIAFLDARGRVRGASD
ncbi:MAG: phosphatase PAP2 family protein [Thermoleophilia bacterium]